MATMRERFEAWQRWWAAQAGPTPDQLQQAEDERQRRAGAAFTDEVLRGCARYGVWFPGDSDEPRTPGHWGGEGGGSWSRLWRRGP